MYSGYYCGIPVTVAATGMGSPSVAMIVEELIAAGGKVFIRAGSCASIQSEAHIGSLIIATAAVRDEGTSPYYAPLMYPAVADFNVTRALIEAADAQCHPYFLGIIRSTDSFYEGERKIEIIETWRQRNALAFEMEASALFTLSSISKCYSGAILVPGSNLITGSSTYQGQQVQEFTQGVERMITVSLDALILLSNRLRIE
jgi:uridine phosphorylase